MTHHAAGRGPELNKKEETTLSSLLTNCGHMMTSGFTFLPPSLQTGLPYQTQAKNQLSLSYVTSVRYFILVTRKAATLPSNTPVLPYPSHSLPPSL